MDNNDVMGGMFDKKARTAHTFTIPENLRVNDVTAVTLCELTAQQELQASKYGRYDLLKSQYEATNLAIVRLSGKAVDRSSLELDRFWENASPRLRSLLLQAYNKMSSPSVEETDSFFDSEIIEVVKV